MGQISEYIESWIDENNHKKLETEIVNPSIEELELFNLASGIDRQLVSKK